MSDEIITLIGFKQAKIGNEFYYKGKSKECEPCKFKNTCLNLEMNEKYKIVNIKNTNILSCFVHESGVCAVCVVKAPFKICVESRKAIKGSKMEYTPLNCDILDCSYYELCHPPNFKEGDKFTILNVEDDILDSCDNNSILKIVEVVK